jgi:2-hydroxychromene-2-carboxylate isomerase
MSLKRALMPAVTSLMLSRRSLLARRSLREGLRVIRGARRVIDYFHQVDDPYSALLAEVLPAFSARYDVDVRPHVVGPPAQAAAPEPEMLVAYSRRDARRLALKFDLGFPASAAQPSAEAIRRAEARLVAAIDAGEFVAVAGEISAALWGAAAVSGPLASDTRVTAHLREATALRSKLGHYLGGTFYYAGEWYWGIDRLYHLEQRLQDLGVVRGEASSGAYLCPPPPDAPVAAHSGGTAPIDFFFSFRSPYSAIAAPRVFALGRAIGAPIHLRFVLPMVMRGLPVPAAKRMYIVRDAAREAFVRDIPFGRICDPVGRPTERGLSLVPMAERAGRGEAYVLSVMHGVWAEGVDMGSDRGLRKLAERAGLQWSAAREALSDDSWRTVAEVNRAEMFSLGVWGVPSFRVGDEAVWGQDRLWAVCEAATRVASEE